MFRIGGILWQNKWKLGILLQGTHRRLSFSVWKHLTKFALGWEICKYKYICNCQNNIAWSLFALFAWWHLTPLSAIFQLYCGGQFYWWRKPEDPEKTTTCRKSLTNFNVVHLALIEIRTHNISSDRHWLHR